MTAIFVVCTGQDDNIGDVVLRRHLLRFLRAYGDLHVYVGGLSGGFVDGLELGPGDSVYRDKSRWRSDAAASALRRRTWLVDKPGELQVDAEHRRAQVGLLPLSALVRVRRGGVFRIGIGQRSGADPLSPFFRAVLRASTVVAWRDVVSQASAGFGEVVPDLGFGETTPSDTSTSGRRRLVVSYRDDRPMLSEQLTSALIGFAERNNLLLTVVTQVSRDDQRSRELAEVLGAELISWPADRSHVEQEELLRRVYAEAAMVVSDRLHVLIVAMTQGAVPACLVEWPEQKISRHLEAAGFSGAVHDVSGRSATSNDELLLSLLARRGEAADALGHAQARLADLARRMSRYASSSRAG